MDLTTLKTNMKVLTLAELNSLTSYIESLKVTYNVPMSMIEPL